MADATLEGIACRALLGTAQELGRSGRFREAEALLDQLTDSQRSMPEALDLRARIKAQQGNLAQAERLWEEALARSPGDPSFMAGQRRIAALQRRPWWRPILGWFAGVLALASLIGAVGVIVVTRTTSQAESLSAAEEARTERASVLQSLRMLRASNDELTETVRALKSEVANADARVAQQLEAQQQQIESASVRLSGVSAEVSGVRRKVDGLRSAIRALAEPTTPVREALPEAEGTSRAATEPPVTEPDEPPDAQGLDSP